ncbi:hypothetical protein ABT336_16950 [Micromonospora sp. NPDC000207]|uniref:hypothetical protein n=1 Tax=Micromonospora sp. NPDC000207 TaxID=3154246 RepID=UPI0033253890
MTNEDERATRLSGYLQDGGDTRARTFLLRRSDVDKIIADPTVGRLLDTMIRFDRATDLAATAETHRARVGEEKSSYTETLSEPGSAGPPHTYWNPTHIRVPGENSDISYVTAESIHFFTNKEQQFIDAAKKAGTHTTAAEVKDAQARREQVRLALRMAAKPLVDRYFPAAQAALSQRMTAEAARGVLPGTTAGPGQSATRPAQGPSTASPNNQHQGR